MNLYDYRRPCPKCGNTSVNTKFVAAMGEERMERRCGRCTATWSERPLDSVKPPRP